MIFLQPQYCTPSGEILNVISSKDEKIGYLMYLYKEDKDIYILGHLDDVGEKQNYLDIVGKFISGLKEACGTENDPFVRICCGGETLSLNPDEDA